MRVAAPQQESNINGITIADPERHGKRGAEGGARPRRAISARSSTSRSRSKARANSSRPPTSRPSAPSRPNSEGAPRLWMLFEESGAERRLGPAAPLDRRSARRHHQFPARHSAFRDLDRARARRRDRRRRHLRADSRRDVLGREGRRRLSSTTAGCGSRHGAQLGEAVIGTGMPYRGRADHGIYLASCRGHGRRPAASGVWVRRRSTSPMSRPAGMTASGNSASRRGISPPGILLVREAGGYVSDMGGGHDMMTSGDVLAANAHLHLPLAALLKEAVRRRPPAA